MRKVLFTPRPYSSLRITLLLVVGFVLLSTTAYSQGTASIVGTVSDPCTFAVPNAKVTITNTETGSIRDTTTNASGSYAARELAIGRYNVRVVTTGFKSYERTGVTLNVNDTVRVDAASRSARPNRASPSKPTPFRFRRIPTRSARPLPRPRCRTSRPTAAMSSSLQPWYPAPQPPSRISIPRWLKPKPVHLFQRPEVGPQQLADQWCRSV